MFFWSIHLWLIFLIRLAGTCLLSMWYRKRVSIVPRRWCWYSYFNLSKKWFIERPRGDWSRWPIKFPLSLSLVCIQICQWFYRQLLSSSHPVMPRIFLGSYWDLSIILLSIALIQLYTMPQIWILRSEISHIRRARRSVWIDWLPMANTVAGYSLSGPQGPRGCASVTCFQ